MTNGAMNVEIGNPAYKIYEGDPDDDAGELLDSDFALDPDKVRMLNKLWFKDSDLVSNCANGLQFYNISFWNFLKQHSLGYAAISFV